MAVAPLRRFDSSGASTSGCVSERRGVQEGPDFGYDTLLLLFADYASPAQAIGFDRHQSR